MEKQNYIGRKVKGFSFVDTERCSYVEEMNEYIGKIGVIISYSLEDDTYTAYFKNDYWFYPASIIEQYLVPEEEDETELRDQFAMQALNGLLATFKWGGTDDIDGLTYMSYLIANSMLKSRNQVK